MPFSLSMNLRQKVTLGIVVAIMGVGLLGVISYHYLTRIEQALRLAEVIDDLSNDILEVRRYEKNYLLYALEEDAHESLRYVEQGVRDIDELLLGRTETQGLPANDSDVAKLRSQLVEYRQVFEPLAGVALTDQNRNQLRELGKSLVETSQRIVATQRRGILHIVMTLKQQLLLSIVAMLLLAFVFAWFVGWRIVRALHQIEAATVQIVRGDFAPLPVPASRDETHHVIEAFNRMIVELDKRQNQLVQEKKLASLGVLTSGIAHQLNNPLNNISTSCQILREEGLLTDKELTTQMLDNIFQEVLRSRDIVKGLLEFSRSTEFSLKPVRLADVLERSARLVASQLPSSVEILRVAPDDLVVPVDAQRMQEVFLNLLINAIQAIQGTASGAGVIRLEARADDAAGQAVITVADTGPGIQPEYLGRIFDPFFTLKDVGAGTGLGLSIVFGIIKKHGGTIHVESPAGQGAVFTIRLPLTGQDATEVVA